MIRVSSLEEIPQPARDRIKAKVMRRFISHLQERPEISDDTLRSALGFDRETLEAMYADLSEKTRTEHEAQVRERTRGPSLAPLVAGVVASQAPMAQSLTHAANLSAPTPTAAERAASQAERGVPVVRGGAAKTLRD